MNSIREYRMPLLIAGGALVVAILLWVVLISPQNAKVASLKVETEQLQVQESTLQARLTALQSEGQKLSSNCTDLEKITTEIPSVQSPTDLDAEESSFEVQFNDLAASSGVSLAQFSGFAPSAASAARPTAGVAATAGVPATAGVTAVPTTLTVQGNYGQITAFVNGLDGFPRLFVIQKFVLAFGAASTSASGGAVSSSATGAASATQPPLWIGGQQTSPSNGPYNLQITGSIYYTSEPNALATCSKAKAAEATNK